MSDITRNSPQPVAPQQQPVPMDSILNKRRSESYGKGISQLGQHVKKYLNEKLFTPQKPRGGIR